MSPSIQTHITSLGKLFSPYCKHLSSTSGHFRIVFGILAAVLSDGSPRVSAAAPHRHLKV